MRVYKQRTSVGNFSIAANMVNDPQADVDGNWITVIIGENGTGKSFYLRSLAGVALGRNSYNLPGLGRVEAVANIIGHADRVIALSGTHNDRFPVTSGIPISRAPTNYDTSIFKYFGPKYSGSLVGRSRSASVFLHSMLRNFDKIKERSEVICDILSHVGYGSKLIAELELRRGVGEKRGGVTLENLKSHFERMKELIGRGKGDQVSPCLGYIEMATRDKSSMERILNVINDKITLDIDLATGIGLTGYRDPQELSCLLEIGVLSIENLVFERVGLAIKDRSYKSGSFAGADALSSGQWQMIVNLVNLCLWVTDNSLILIDEPENSLHPAWQREYIALIRRSLHGVRGCHLIIATHSPLIAAGVKPGEGNIVLFSRSNDRNNIEVSYETTAYGKLPGDVLQENFNMENIRPPEISETVDRMLEIVGSDIKVNKEEFRVLADKLDSLTSNLPSNDPLVSVVEALFELAENE